MTTTIKAAVFHGPNQPLSIEKIEIDDPREHEVLVRTVASGVCHSDLHFVDGLYPTKPPAVLGHEPAGIVEKVGSGVSYVRPGDHVIACLSAFCGYCEQCMTGHPSRCSNRFFAMRAKDDTPRLSQGGKPINQFANLSSYAEKMLVHENSLVKIRNDMPLDRAALIGCGVTTGVGAVLNTAKIEPGSTVAVFGAGVDFSFEAIGLKKVAEQAFNCIKPGGTATIIGMIPMGEKIELDGYMFLTERKLQGSGMGSNRFRIDMPRYIDFYLQGRLNLDDMVSRRGKLEDVNDAFRAMKAGEVARTVLMFD